MFFGTDERLTEVSLPGELRQIINDNRAAAFPPPHPDLAEIIAGFTPRNFNTEEDARIAGILRHQRSLQDEQPSPLSRSLSRTDHLDIFLSHEKLKEEINFLFGLLRYGYGGYWYFGGNDIFIPVRDAMLEQLAGMNDPLQIYWYLNEIILPPLQGIIADNHFHIHNTIFRARRYMLYMNEEFILRRGETENLFATEIDGVIHRVLNATPLNAPSANAHSTNAHSAGGILPTLTPDGEFAWAFGLITAGFRQSKEMRVLFENLKTGETHYRTVILPMITSPWQAYSTLVTHEIDGITVLENRSLARYLYLVNDSPDEQLRMFYQSGYMLRGKPVLILDLRDNLGGYRNFAREWIRAHTGQVPIDSLLFGNSALYTLTAWELRGRSSEELHNFILLKERLNTLRSVRDAISNVTEFFADGNRSLRKSIPKKIATLFRRFASDLFSRNLPESRAVSPQILIPNKNLVIVLIDNNVSSAGEWFVGYLRQLKNVLVVGTNTNGTLLAGGTVTTNLPHSGIEIRLGRRLTLRPDLSQFEGVGFMPDLWVPPGESLERVLRFIERYGLASK